MSLEVTAREQPRGKATPEMIAEITPGSRWVDRNPRHPGGVARVLGVVDGYVVARWKGCLPWLEHVNNWHRTFVKAAPLPPRKQRREP